ncbi:MAG: 50S ribosomal protein L3 [Clostridia bacterium]|nr:50S ribosomal protein L3 [Clostridia bacterium]
MNKAILGKKLGMTQVFATNGLVIPVTVVEATPNKIVQIKSEDKDGYNAIVVAYGSVRKNLVNKPKLGVFEKANVEPARILREFRIDDVSNFKIGQEIKCDQFVEGDKVDVIGTSKGHGFTGLIKRWGMHHQDNTHGGNKIHRHQSLGSGPGIAKVFKGKRMAGRYGGTRTTVLNLEVVRVDSERNLILVKGAIPGPRNGVVMVRNAVKTQ